MPDPTIAAQFEEMRLTKPLSQHTVLSENATVVEPSDTASHSETPPNSVSTATISATAADEIQAVATLRNLVTDFLVWHESEDENVELFAALESEFHRVACELGIRKADS